MSDKYSGRMLSTYLSVCQLFAEEVCHSSDAGFRVAVHFFITYPQDIVLVFGALIVPPVIENVVEVRTVRH